MRTIIIISFLALSISGYSQTIAPSVISSAGNYTTTGGYSLGYVVAEMSAVETYHANNYILTQGFLQPVGNITGVEEVKNLTVNSIALYPNPAVSSTNLVINLLASANVLVSVYSLDGKLLEQHDYKHVEAGKQSLLINTAQLAAGNYLVKVQTESLVQTVQLSKL